jgi:hypothetical protein
MAIPRQVRRSDSDTHDALTWNAMVDLCAMEPLETCSPIQRKAALLFWYQSEVNNGGHFQYFMNRSDYPHREVLALLRELGASRSAAALKGALGRVESILPMIARRYGRSRRGENRRNSTAVSRARRRGRRAPGRPTCVANGAGRKRCLHHLRHQRAFHQQL